MLYLLDANVLIQAHKTYYPLDRVPQFWAWLLEIGISGDAKLPYETLEEVTNGTDDLAKWARQREAREALELSESVDRALLNEVQNVGYAPDLSDSEIEVLGKDPFLIAYARCDVASRCVVTKETSQPSKRRQNKKIPDVCNQFGVSWITDFEFFRRHNFRT